MARLQPLPIDAVPELADSWKVYLKALGFVPNSVLILQRKPKMVKALAAMAEQERSLCVAAAERLRAAGYDAPMATVEEGVAQYIEWLHKHV